jgi:hypothetical protein
MAYIKYIIIPIAIFIYLRVLLIIYKSLSHAFLEPIFFFFPHKNITNQSIINLDRPHKIDLIMEDIFSILATGASFSKKRNAESMRVFRKQAPVISEDSHSSSAAETLEDEEGVNTFRNKLRIKVKGDNVANPITSFSAMPLHTAVKATILAGIEGSRWKEPTAVQMQAIPLLLEGRDVLAGAPTGSGKTAAYTLPILSLISKWNKAATKKSSVHGVLGLVLAPTRELAEQIHREVLRLIGSKKIKSIVLTKQLVTRYAHYLAHCLNNIRKKTDVVSFLVLSTGKTNQPFQASIL